MGLRFLTQSQHSYHRRPQGAFSRALEEFLKAPSCTLSHMACLQADPCSNVHGTSPRAREPKSH